MAKKDLEFFSIPEKNNENSYSEKMTDLLSLVSPMEYETGAIRPTLDPLTSKYDKGVLPGTDLEENRAQSQSSWDKWGNGVTKFVGKTSTAVLGGTVGTLYGIGSMITNKEMSSFYDNEFQHTLDRWNEKMEMDLPNYISQEEQNYNFWQSATKGGANFWSHDVLGALSFTAGAVLTEMSWSAMTAATLGAFAPVQAAGTLGLATRIMKTTGALSKTAKATKALDYVNKFNQFAKAKNVGKVARQFVTGAGYEAGVESRAFQETAVNELSRQWLAANPTYKEVPEYAMAEIMEDVAKASNGVFVTNMGIVGLSNMVTLPRIFGPGVNSTRVANKSILRQMAMDISEPYKAAYKSFSQGRNIIDATYRVAKNPLAEGFFEEGNQSVTQKAALNYITAKYNPNGLDNVASMVEAIGEGFQETYSSKEGWKEIGIGAIIGSLGAPNINAYSRSDNKDGSKGKLTRDKEQPIWTGGIAGEFQERAKKRAKIDKMVGIMNNKDVLVSTKALFKSAIRQQEINKKFDEAILNDDMFEQKNLESDEFINYVTSRLDGGHFASIEEEVSAEINKMSLKDFAKEFNYSNMSDKKLMARKNAVINSANKKADEIKEIAEMVDNTYNGGSEDVRDLLIYSLASAKNIDYRTTGIIDSLTKIAPGIDGRRAQTIYQEVNKLNLNKGWLKTYKDTLKKQKRQLSGFKSAESKKIKLEAAYQAEVEKYEKLKEKGNVKSETKVPLTSIERQLLAKQKERTELAKQKVKLHEEEIARQQAKIDKKESDITALEEQQGINKEKALELIDYDNELTEILGEVETFIKQNPELAPQVRTLMNDLTALELKRLSLLDLYNKAYEKSDLKEISEHITKVVADTEIGKKINRVAAKVDRGEDITDPEDLAILKNYEKEIDEGLEELNKAEEEAEEKANELEAKEEIKEAKANDKKIPHEKYKIGDTVFYNGKEYKFDGKHEKIEGRVWLKDGSKSRVGVTESSLEKEKGLTNKINALAKKMNEGETEFNKEEERLQKEYADLLAARIEKISKGKTTSTKTPISSRTPEGYEFEDIIEEIEGKLELEYIEDYPFRMSFFYQVLGLSGANLDPNDKRVSDAIAKINEEIAKDIAEETPKPLYEYFSPIEDKYGIVPREAVKELINYNKLKDATFELFVDLSRIDDSVRQKEYGAGKLPIAIRIKGENTIIGYLPNQNNENEDERDSTNTSYDEKRKALEKQYDPKKGEQVLGETTLDETFYMHNNFKNKKGDKIYSPIESLQGKNEPIRLAVFDGKKVTTNTGENLDIEIGPEIKAGPIYYVAKTPKGNYRLVALRTSNISEEQAGIIYDIITNPNIDLFTDKTAQQAIKKIIPSKSVEFSSQYLQIDDVKFYVRASAPKGTQGKAHGKVVLSHKGKHIDISKERFVKAVLSREISRDKKTGAIKIDDKPRKHQVDKSLWAKENVPVSYPSKINKDGTIQMDTYDNYVSMLSKKNVLETDSVPGAPFMLPIVKVMPISVMKDGKVATEITSTKKTEVAEPKAETINPIELPTETIDFEASMAEMGFDDNFINPSDLDMELPDDFTFDFNNPQDSVQDETFQEYKKGLSAKHRGTPYSKNYSIQNYEDAKNWFKARFPNVPIEQVQGLLNIGGYYSHGRFEDAMVRLSDIAEEGTIYHESFHVAFWLYATKRERESLLNEVRAKNPNKTDTQLEEILAEEFRGYVMRKGIQEFPYQKRNFFQKLWDYIKQLLGKVNSRDFYNRIATGKLSKELGRERLSQKNAKRYYGIERDRVYGLSAQQTEDVVSTIAYQINKIKTNLEEELRKANKLNDNALAESISKKQNIQYYLDTVFKEYDDYYKGAIKAKSTRYENHFAPIVNNFYENPDGTSISEMALEYLQDMKYEVITRDNAKAESGEKIRRNYSQSDFEIDPSANINHQVKRWISFLEKVGMNGKKEVGYLGKPRFASYGQIHSFLMRNLHGYPKNEMNAKLELLAKKFPQYALLYKRLGNAPNQFKTAFYSHFAGKQKLNHTQMIYEKEDGKKKVKIISANRQSLELQIANGFIDNYYQIEAEAATLKANALKSLKAVRSSLTKQIKPRTEEYKKALIGLGKALTNMGISYTDNNGNNIIALAIDAEISTNPIHTSINEGIRYILDTAETIANNIAEGVNPFENEQTSTRDFARMIENYHADAFTESYFNSEGKKVYSYTSRNYLSEFFNALRYPGVTSQEKDHHIINTFRKYLESPMYKDSIWLSRIFTKQGDTWRINYDNIDLTNFSYIDGVKDQYKDGKRYRKLTDHDFEAMKLNLYINSDAEAFNYFVGMTPSDKPNLPVYKLPRITEEERPIFIRKIIDQEIARINMVNSGQGIDRFDNDANKVWMAFPVMNEMGLIVDGQVADISEDQMQDIIDKITERNQKEAEDKYGDLERLGVISKGVIINIDSNSSLAKGYAATKAKEGATLAFLEDFVMDSRINYYESQSLLGGDSRFYKKVQGEFDSTAEQVSKRVGQYAMGELLDNTQYTNEQSLIEDEFLNNGNYNMLVSEDPTLNKTNEANKIYDTLYPKYEKVYGAKIANEILSPYKNSDPADAQGQCTVDRHYDITRRLGRDNPQYVRAYYKLKTVGKLTDEEMTLFQPFKGVFYDLIDYGDGLLVPMYVKYSLVPLLPKMIEGTQLEDLNKYMEENQIHEMVYHSGVKTGAKNITKLFDDNGNFTPTPINENTAINLESSNWRLQMELPPHHKGEKDKFATQIGRIGIDNIEDDAVYGERFGKDIKDEMQSLRVAEISSSFDKVLSDYSIDKIDKGYKINDLPAFKDKIKKIASSLQLTDQMINSIQINDKGFVIPLSLPTMRRFESIVMSIFKNEIIKQEMPGALSVQVSSQFYKMKAKKVGLTDAENDIRNDLEYKFDEDGNLMYAEIAITNWIAEKYNIREGQDIPNEIREGIGYRIPTSGKNMIIPLRVKRVLPDESGSILIVPKAITTQQGSDFDVDELHIWLPNYRKNEGKLEKIEYIDGTSDADVQKRFDIKYGKIEQGFRLLQKQLTQNDLTTNLEADRFFNLLWAQKDTKAEMDDIGEIFLEAKLDQLGIREYYDSLKKQFNKIPTKEEFAKQSVTEQNTKAARQNRIIEVQTEILQSEHHTIEVMNPNRTDNIEAIVPKVYSESKSLDPFKDADVSELAKRSKEAGESLGIYANYRAALGWMQATNTRFSDSHYILIGKEKFHSLNNIRNKFIKKGSEQGEYVSQEVGSLISMSVDDAGKPISYKVNSNTYTAPTIGMLTAMHSIDYALGFISQASVRKMTSRYFNSRKLNGYSDSEQEIYKKLRENYISLIKSKDVKKSLTKIYQTNLSVDGLFELHDTKKKDDAYYAHQVRILDTFMKYKKMSQKLSNTITMLKVDSTDAYGASHGALESRKYNIDKMLSESRPMLIGPQSIFAEDSKYPFLKEFYEKGIVAPLEIMKEIYPYYGEGYLKVKKSIAEQLGRELTTDEIDLINRQGIINYLAKNQSSINLGSTKKSDTTIDMFNPVIIRQILFKGENSLLNKAMMMKKLHPQYAFMRNLFASQYKTDLSSPFDVIQFNNAVQRDRIDKDRITNSYEDIMSISPEAKKFMNGMLIYNMATRGMVPGINAYSEYISIKQLQEVGFVDVLNKLSKDKDNEDLFETFDEIFFKANWDDNAIVPNVTKKDAIKKKFKGGGMIGFTVTKERYQLEDGEGWKAYLKRVTYDKTGKHTTIFELDQATETEASYVITNKYGLPGKLLEVSGHKSILPENNNLRGLDESNITEEADIAESIDNAADVTELAPEEANFDELPPSLPDDIIEDSFEDAFLSESDMEAMSKLGEENKTKCKGE